MSIGILCVGCMPIALQGEELPTAAVPVSIPTAAPDPTPLPSQSKERESLTDESFMRIDALLHALLDVTCAKERPYAQTIIELSCAENSTETRAICLAYVARDPAPCGSKDPPTRVTLLAKCTKEDGEWRINIRED